MENVAEYRTKTVIRVRNLRMEINMANIFINQPMIIIASKDDSI